MHEHNVDSRDQVRLSDDVIPGALRRVDLQLSQRSSNCLQEGSCGRPHVCGNNLGWRGALVAVVDTAISKPPLC
ncbi:MAG: hypothetical protein EOO65_06240 [Methanosarcinales archaeon]|nr:MAG: hypothetical protein EOO65_06240 [Methanosarcinales archaeon]